MIEFLRIDTEKGGRHEPTRLAVSKYPICHIKTKNTMKLLYHLQLEDALLFPELRQQREKQIIRSGEVG